MSRLLIPSDHLSIRSDEYSQSVRPSAAKTPPQTLLGELPPLDRLLRGALTETYKRCGRPTCHCRDGPGHGPKRYLVISQPGGRPRREYVPNAACEQVAEWLGNFRRLRDTLNQICALNAELLRRREDLE